MPNNNQIDNTSYYMLPSGRQLEDFIADNRLSFAEGSALKYMWRAGKKDGESREKDIRKAEHYVVFIARRTGAMTADVSERLRDLARRARAETRESVEASRITASLGAHSNAPKKSEKTFSGGPVGV